MRLIDNPILRTQWRLARRRSLWPVVLAGVAIGMVMSINLIDTLSSSYRTARSIHHAAESGFFTLVLLQALMLVGGTGLRIISIIDRERTSGLLDSMRTTPLSARQLLIGYVVGGMLVPLAGFIVMMPFAFMHFILAELPLQVWVVTEGLIVSTGVLAGLGALSLSLFISKRAALPAFIGIVFASLFVGAGGEQATVLSHLLPATTFAALFEHPDYASDLIHTAYVSVGVPIPTWAVTLPLQLLFGALLASFGLKAIRPRLTYRSLALHLGLGALVLLMFQAFHSTVVGLAHGAGSSRFFGESPSEIALSMMVGLSSMIISFALAWARSPSGLPGAPVAARSLRVPLLAATVATFILALSFVVTGFQHSSSFALPLTLAMIGTFSAVFLADGVGQWAFAPNMPSRRVVLPLVIVSVILLPVMLAMLFRAEELFVLLPLGPNLVGPPFAYHHDPIVDVVGASVAQLVAFAAFCGASRSVGNRTI